MESNPLTYTRENPGHALSVIFELKAAFIYPVGASF